MMFYVRQSPDEPGDQLMVDKNVDLCRVRARHNSHLKADFSASCCINYTLVPRCVLFYQIALMSLLTARTWQNSQSKFIICQKPYTHTHTHNLDDS